MECTELTLVDRFADRVAASELQPGLHEKHDERLKPSTWSELDTKVRQVASALCALGVRSGDRVVQYADKSVAWIFNDLAIQAADSSA